MPPTDGPASAPVPAVKWISSDRYAVAAAPGALALVQDLLNTIAAGRPRGADLLADVEAAQWWATGSLQSWSSVTGLAVGPITITDSDLEPLHDLRSDLDAAMRQPRDSAGPLPQALCSVTLGAELGYDGTVHLSGRGDGWRRIASTVMVEMFAAQQSGTWQRLKICGNPRCNVAFYDRSRNTSGVWHDVRTCGNTSNLRASRARRKARSAMGGDH
jgi:CGNR zinc finger/Putative stress-induced transcription regulator